ncbi:MAG: hypothetical protein ACJARD_001330 [Alphaproteobacteria bacterium]|jgi:hypothetical protein
MKLVERVLNNISSEEISDIASEFNFSAEKMASIVNAVIPGVLSAFKARIVSSMNSGDMSPILGVLSNTETSLNINDLFDGNETALNILYHRISEFSNIDLDKTAEIIETTMPTISNAVATMFQEFSADVLMSPESNSHINELISSESGYEQAVNSANNFLDSVFGTTNAGEKIIQGNIVVENDDFVQNLFDLFDQDNDGSVMDDIYRMLVR